MVDQSSYLRTNQRLFDETLIEFSSKSFDFASLNEIVKRSEFNKGSFYYRFSDKLDLYIAMINLINSEHLVLYNQRVLDRISEASLTDLAMEAIASLSDLEQVDVRYVRVLERYALENEEFQRLVTSRSVDFVHLRFLSELDRRQIPNREEKLHMFYDFFRLYYFSHSLFESKISYLASIRSSFLDVELKAQTNGSAKTIDLAVRPLESSEGSSPTNLTTALIVGSRQSGKSGIALKLANDAAVQYNSVVYVDGPMERLIWYKLGKKNQLSFRQLEKNAKRLLSQSNSMQSSVQIASYLRLSLNSKGDDGLSLRQRWVTLWLLLTRIDSLILDDFISTLSETDQTLIFNTILKFRARGVTMVLTSNPHPILWQKSSHIAFISSHGVSMYHPTEKIHAKYPTESILVRYLEDGLERRQMWDDLQWKKPEFTQWLATKQILEIQSLPQDFASIFKMETGEVLE